MGLTVLDTSVLVGFLNAHDSHHEASTAAIREALSHGDELCVPLIAYAEVLVGAIRQQGEQGIRLIDDLLASLPARVIDPSREVDAVAADIRAHHPSVKMPDAFVLATARVHRADRVISADRRWPVEVGVAQYVVGSSKSQEPQ